MKILQLLTLSIFVFMLGCQEDDNAFGTVQAPTNLTVTVDVANDQSGNVSVTPTADGALNVHVIFVEGNDPVVVSSGETATYRYTQSGQYTQIINVIAYGRGGASSSRAISIDLDVRLVIDPVVLANIAGNANEGKRWIWDSSNAGHFGVGDPVETFPNFFSAAPNQLDPCMYDDVLVFSHDGQDNYTFDLETQGATFINWAEIKRFFPDADPQVFVDECRNIDDQIELNTDFTIVEDQTTGALKLVVTNSTMSYYAGIPEYEITELNANRLVVRGIQDPFDPPGDMLAWYHTFVPESGGQSTDCGASTGETGTGNLDVLVWAEEFDTDGAPCSENWAFDLGTGDNGWGNEEEQYYTDREDNIKVEDGVLKITAKTEDFQGSPYTSARIKTQDLFEFTYGKIEARAKLPTGGGTWPALWLLGADFQTNPWPAAGEIDYMEHVGNNQDVIFSSLHYPGNSGGNAITQSTTVPGVSDEFHIYAVEWTVSEIRFSVDGNVYHTFANSLALPFNKDFFLIVNVAMGGTFGGNVDPNFVESTMEVDYIRVYQ
jgi:hypothetical protein